MSTATVISKVEPRGAYRVIIHTDKGAVELTLEQARKLIADLSKLVYRG